MDTALWVVQVVLGLAFIMAGAMKMMQSKEKLHESMEWVEDFSEGTITAIGVVEVLGGLGLILPAVTGILPWLVPLAGLGLALDMGAAALVHGRRGETQMIPINIVLLLLALFVAYGRFTLVPLT